MSKEDEVRQIAYSIWEKENRPEGKDHEHWFKAESILEQNEKPVNARRRTKTSSKPGNTTSRKKKT
jgi:hypothetical protein